MRPFTHVLLVALCALLGTQAVFAQSGWQAQTSGTANSLNSVHFANAYHGIAVGATGTVRYTINGGLDWNSSTSALGSANLNGVWTYSDGEGGTTGIAIAVGAGGGIMVSTDLGATWTAKTSGTSSVLYAVSGNHAGGNYATVVGAGGTILTTTDYGDTWESQTSGTTKDLLTVSMSRHQQFYQIAGGDSTILRSTDVGVSWSSQSFPSSFPQRRVTGVDFPHDSSAFAVLYGEVEKSTDIGESWSSLSPGGAFNVGVSFSSRMDGIAVAFSPRVIRTTDGGSSWTDETPSGTSPNSVSMNSQRVATFVGGSGQIYRYQKFFITSFSPARDGIAGVASNLSLTFNTSVTLTTGLIELYDSGDNLVEAFGVASPRISGDGTTTITIDPTNDLVSGTSYYVTMSQGFVEDGSGNPVQAFFYDQVWNFTVDGDPPVVQSTSPADGGTMTAGNDNLVITFDGDVTAQSSKNISIYTSDDVLVEQIAADGGKVSVNGDEVTIDPDTYLGYGEYYVQIDAGAFEDIGNNEFAGIADETTWNFTVANVLIPTTSAATNIAGTTVTLNGSVNPQGDSAVVRFLWGTSSGTYTDSLTASPDSVAGTSATAVSAAVTGLSQLTTYYFVVASQSATTYARGSELTFGTSSAIWGNSLTFVSSNSTYAASHDPVSTATDNFTLEAWVKWDGTNTGGVQAIVENGYAGTGGGFGIHLWSDDKLAFLINGLAWRIATTEKLDEDNWNHVALVRNGGAWSLYKNGVAVTMGGDPEQAPGAASTGFFIGGDSVAYRFNGAIDEVRMSNSVRYTSNFSPETGPFTSDGSTAALYHLDEGSGSTSADASGNGKTLTLYNSPTWTGSDNPLPVQMSQLSAERTALGVDLRWSTVTEIDNAGWNVERRVIAEGEIRIAEWKTVGFVEGAGTSTSPREYQFIDDLRLASSDWENLHSTHPVIALSALRFAYRLKQLDRSGSFSYSEEIEVNLTSAPRIFFLSQNYPNPFNPSTTLSYSLEADGPVSLKVFDLIGREVASLVNEEQKAGIGHKVQFDASRLSSGIYFSRLTSGGKHIVKRMVLVK